MHVPASSSNTANTDRPVAAKCGKLLHMNRA